MSELNIQSVTYPLIIITPCSRPENLQKLYESIQFDKITVWLIIYDTRHENVPFIKQFDKETILHHSKIIELECKEEGIAGHQIRNIALNIIMHGLIYFLDDDNIIHPFFWHICTHFKQNTINTFNLLYTTGNVRVGNNPTEHNIDTAQYVFDKSLVGDILFDVNNYSADGAFINSLCENNKEKVFHYNYIAAYYNWLRKG